MRQTHAFPRYPGTRPNHVRVSSSLGTWFECFVRPRKSDCPDTQHVSSCPIGKLDWVGRYKNTLR